jgi:putative heme-binding domain-containing protein
MGWSTWLDVLGPKKSPLEQLKSKTAGLIDAAREAVIDDSKPLEERIAACSLLGHDEKEREGDVSLLAGLLTPQTSPELQRAAVRAIAKSGDPKTPQTLLANWSTMSPEVRVSAVDLLLGNEQWAMELLRQIEAGKVPAADIDAPHRSRIERLAAAAVKQLAEKVFGPRPDAARPKVVESYGSALQLAGDAQRGFKVYFQNCAVCHRIAEIGNEIGPDLRSVRDWPADNILANVLDPNRKVEPRYLSYTATLKSGEVLFGVIAAESGTSLTLNGLDGKSTTVLRANVKSLECSNKSLMPDGLETAINKQQMADLIKFLKDPPATLPTPKS